MKDIILIAKILFVVEIMEVKSEKNMRAAQYRSADIDDLYIGSVPLPEVKDEEVLIKIIATAINRSDTIQRRRFPTAGESTILGLEAAGIVEKLSPTCSNRWKKGDRVMALLAAGGNAEFVAVPEKQLMSVPDKMSFSEAAAIPEVWLTAYQLLVTIGNLSKDDTVLIHAAGSGVGTSAVQLVKMFGAQSLITAGSESKIMLAKSLGANEGFNYKEGNWAEKVLNATSGKGVNLILDCVGASYWSQNAESIAVDGRWILYGLLGGDTISGDLFAKMLMKRIRLEGTVLKARSNKYKAELIKNFTKDVLPHFNSGQLKPIIDQVLPFGKLSEAHRLMEANANAGKIILLVQPEDKIDLYKEEL